jgi:hypothetical protein
MTIEEAGDVLHRLQVPGDRIADVRPLHLDGDEASFAQRRTVHLSE